MPTIGQVRPSPYIGQILDTSTGYRTQDIDIVGVPNRIRTGVAAVKEGQMGYFSTSVDCRGRSN
jgi:hypothetical protein